MHPLWFYKHQHDNPVRSKLFVACQRWWFLLHTHPVSWNCAYHLRMELSDGGSLPNLVRNCRCTIVTHRHFMKCKHTKRLLNAVLRHLSELRSKRRNSNYCTPRIIKENFERISWSIGAATYCYLKCIMYDELLKPRQSFRMILYFSISAGMQKRVSVHQLNLTNLRREIFINQIFNTEYGM